MRADEYSLLGLLADIRAAAGDPQGRLMQAELVEHVRGLKARADALEQQRAALVEALKGLLPEAGKNFSNSETWDRHRKAIAALRAAGVEQ